ncbi:MAG: ImmA/IrrE family metallo-endopeptidase [Tissierellales bacterium]|nr:ImmA/IrrE family metallo-endopeptidase [Tissierellales bacterium]
MDKLIFDILDSHNITGAPVDLIKIANKEKRISLELIPNTDNKFGRIEYFRSYGHFVIYCSENVLFDNVARFSLGHELGHYYLEEHRQRLYQGEFHCSKSGFICDNQLEREADEFAARLMIPSLYMRKKIEAKPKLSINNFIEISDECNTSLTCASFRYVESDIEPCAIIVSENHRVKFYKASESAEKKGFTWLGQKTIPVKSPTISAFEDVNKGKVLNSGGVSEEWFSKRPQKANLQEEAFCLGNTGLVLTMLYFEFENKDDYFLPSEKYYR